MGGSASQPTESQKAQIRAIAQPAKPVAVLNLGNYPTFTNPASPNVSGIFQAVFSPNGKYIVTADYDGSACVWLATSASTYRPDLEASERRPDRPELDPAGGFQPRQQ